MGGGRKCSVPGCSSNYSSQSPYIPCFQYPKDRRQAWIRAINRENFTPSLTAVVCVEHFEERYIIREDRVVRPDGTLLVVPRTKLALSTDAVPTIFKGQPSYLSRTTLAPRKTPADRKAEIALREREAFLQSCKEDEISSYTEFLKLYKKNLTCAWLSLECEGFTVFYIIDVLQCPEIRVSFKVMEDLSICIYSTDKFPKSFKEPFEDNYKCDRWSKFVNLLAQLSISDKPTELSLFEKVSPAVQVLEKAISELEDFSKSSKLIFMKSQLELLEMKQPRYSPDVLLWSAKLFFAYPAAYLCVRNSKVLTLPHPSYLRKLSHIMKSGVNSDHFLYLKKKSNLLKPNERVVNLLLDEIYVDKCIDFKSGHLYGLSENADTLATTVQSFMITSVFSHNKDIVSLFPVSNMTAQDLHSYCCQVLQMLDDCGYTVLTIISDNNKLNGKMFSLLAGGDLQCYIPNPQHPEKKLFFLFDSVHMLKSLRNNWINQNATNQTLYFPHAVTGEIFKAGFSDLKKIYEEEKNDVIKVAPKLSLKVLYPTSIERQNVSYATKLFHESNLVALETKFPDDAFGTKYFLLQVMTWWNVMNVKHPSKGHNKNNEFMEPIKSVNSKGVEFLKEFSIWMAECQNLRQLLANEKKLLKVPTKGGLLSKETVTALSFTTESILKLIPYIFDVYRAEYILLGKFQTDPIEARFGQYRQMSGGKYQVSCTQILESETKLKILSLMSLYSNLKGEFKISDLQFDKITVNDVNVEIPEKFYSLYNSSDDVDISKSTMGVVVYIAGYVSHKICQKVVCLECKCFLIKDQSLEVDCDISDNCFSFLKLTSRGGLKYPQPVVIDCVLHTYKIFVKILRKYECEFIRVKQPKQLLIRLVMDKLEICNESLAVTSCQKCNCQYFHLVKQCVSALSNIFLNNYTKVKNDEISSNKGKRKLSTLLKL